MKNINTMKNLLFVALVMTLFTSCNNGSGGSAPVVDASGYILEAIPGSNIQIATVKDENGDVTEQGFLQNGVKVGTWTTYKAGNEFPQTIISYVDGQYTGPYLEFNDRGQLELKAGYLNNQLHGEWGKYKFGRPEKTASYKNGELDGIYKEYFVRDGKIQKEVSYKNGKEDGTMRYYNQEGEITVEYEFKNGEKVSGGILNPDAPNDPK